MNEKEFIALAYMQATPEQKAELQAYADALKSGTAKAGTPKWLQDLGHSFSVNMANLPKAINETLTAVTDPLRTETTTTTTTPPPPPPEKDNTMLYVGLAVLGVLLIAGIGYFMYKKS